MQTKSKLSAAYDRSRVPLYIQVASVLRQRIQAGHWAIGDKISTLEELEEEFQVARVTVRQAVEMLRDEGLVSARQGRGTFVSSVVPDRHWLKLETTWASLIASVKENVPRPITLAENVPPPLLKPEDGELAPEYVSLKSLQFRDDQPYSIVNLLLARHVFEMDRDVFLTGPAMPALAGLKKVKVKDAHQTLIIGSADPTVADLMKIPLGAATVESHCVVVDAKNIAIYVADIVYRSDCIKLQIDLLRSERG